MTYAEATSVSVVRSRLELEKMLGDRGAKRIGLATDDGLAAVQFDYGGLRIRLKLPLPTLETAAIRYKYPAEKNEWSRGERSEAAKRSLLEQAMRSRWRAFVLAVKAKLVSIEAGVETVEQAFFAHVVTATGKTMFEVATGDSETFKRFDVKQLGAGA